MCEESTNKCKGKDLAQSNEVAWGIRWLGESGGWGVKGMRGPMEDVNSLKKGKKAWSPSFSAYPTNRKILFRGNFHPPKKFGRK